MASQYDLDDQLHNAVGLANLEGIQKAIDAGADINHDYGCIINSILMGGGFIIPDVIKLLIDNGLKQRSITMVLTRLISKEDKKKIDWMINNIKRVSVFDILKLSFEDKKYNLFEDYHLKVEKTHNSMEKLMAVYDSHIINSAWKSQKALDILIKYIKIITTDTIKISDDIKNEALYAACSNKKWHNVKTLVDFGADVCHSEFIGKCIVESGDIELLNYTIDRGLKISISMIGSAQYVDSYEIIETVMLLMTKNKTFMLPRTFVFNNKIVEIMYNEIIRERFREALYGCGEGTKAC